MPQSQSCVAETVLLKLSTSSSGSVITFLGAHKQTRQAARRGDFDFHAVPLAIINETVGFVANRVLVPQLQRDLLENVVHLGRGARKECLASGNARKLIENSLTFHAERTAGVTAAQDADRIERYIRLFQQF